MLLPELLSPDSSGKPSSAEVDPLVVVAPDDPYSALKPYPCSSRGEESSGGTTDDADGGGLFVPVRGVVALESRAALPPLPPLPVVLPAVDTLALCIDRSEQTEAYAIVGGGVTVGGVLARSFACMGRAVAHRQ